MIWLFDLDNTLHNAARAIFPAISANMNAFLIENVPGPSGRRLTYREADELRRAYWKAHGATLAGVSRKLDAKAKAFLKATHRFDNLASMVESEIGLGAVLKKLPGRKVILTNSSYSYSRDILKLLGISSSFERIIAVESMRVFGRFEVKPSRKFFLKLALTLKTKLSDCVMVEDSLETLKIAKALGIKTVWAARYLAGSFSSPHAVPDPKRRAVSGRPPYADRKILSLRYLLRGQPVRPRYFE